ncbi:hypothetical protein A2U01_0065350, partial [Trifolium medium]|nr:hypothetical protein [Trifolium medium]
MWETPQMELAGWTSDMRSYLNSVSIVA